MTRPVLFKNKPKYSDTQCYQPKSPFFRPGFINKGNTCYMNAMLQALSALTGFWSALPALTPASDNVPPLVVAFCQVMFQLQSSKKSIDPSGFLDAFSRFMVVDMGRNDFVVNSQQDVPEVLIYLLDSFCGVSLLAKDQIKVVIKKRITCTNCLERNYQEDDYRILDLNVAGDVNLAFSILLTEEVILDRYCEVCMARHYASLEKRVGVSGKYLIIQFKRVFFK